MQTDSALTPQSLPDYKCWLNKLLHFFPYTFEKIEHAQAIFVLKTDFIAPFPLRNEYSDLRLACVCEHVHVRDLPC